MNLLALETATDACSCALWLDGAVRERHQVSPRRHAELVLADLEALLAEAGIPLSQLDGIAFGRGPGSFTGVRIATAVVQGIALGTDLPVAPVSTLAALAQGAVREGGAERVIAALDARRGEVYLGRFLRDDSGLVTPDREEVVLPPDQIALPVGEGWWGVGAGFAAQEAALQRHLAPALGEVDTARLPHAQDVAVLGEAILQAGQGVSAEDALPVYLREQVADKPATLKSRPRGRSHEN